MKAVIYARYSSDNQREESIEGQARDCKEYAERSGLRVIDCYIDRALSAKTDNRPEFQRMIRDSAKGIFDVIIVWKLDRFARNRYDSAHYKSILKKNGVRVVSAMENIAEGSEGILLESILEGYAEYYSVELAEKVNRGMKDNALKCMNNGAPAPFGYYVDENQHLQIDESKAPFVVELYERFSDGEMIKTIIKDLNSRGAYIHYDLKKSRKDIKIHNRPLCYNTARRILTNRKYIGEYKFKDIVIPNGVPAIIEQDLFDRVQKRIEINKKAPAKHKAEDDYLLTTHLFCGKCKSMMVGESGTGKKDIVYRYYKCIKQKKNHTCDKKTVKKEWIEKKVIEAVLSKLMNDDLMNELAEKVYKLQLAEDTITPTIKNNIKSLEVKIENMLNAIENGLVLESTKKRLLNLESQKKQLEDELLQEQMKNPILTKEQILFGLEKFRDLDLTTLKGKRILIDSFVNSIYLYDDYVIITCNYKDGTIKIAFEDIETSDLLSKGSPTKAFYTKICIRCLFFMQFWKILRL